MTAEALPPGQPIRGQTVLLPTPPLTVSGAGIKCFWRVED
jgi:hypothetical protein